MRSITSYLQETLQARRLSTARTGEQPNWHPSFDFGGCDRKSVLNRAGIEGTPHDIRTLRKFWMGDEVHNALKEILEDALKDEAGVNFIGHEVEVKDETYHLSGRIDSLVDVDHEYEVWEYKSAASSSFSYSDFPKEDHVLQVGAYLTFPATCPRHIPPGGMVEGPWSDLVQNRPADRCTLCDKLTVGEPGKLPLPKRARILYWSKDDARIEEYIITPDIKIGDKLIGEEVRSILNRLEEAYKRYKRYGNLPDVLPLVTKKNKQDFDWRCKYCPYFRIQCIPERDWKV